ncbi:hypothetical protein I4U23_004727 [Adineta vaga]|nr:hypothetical protein I4U23_004727 [Adineta vaga]
MTKNIHCDRLHKNRAGDIEKVPPVNGGGIRICIWNHVTMDFHEIHEDLRTKYSIPSQQKSVLYDIEWKELDRNRYHTFTEYINKNGFMFKGTLLYLFTCEDDNIISSMNDNTHENEKKLAMSQTKDNSIHTAKTFSFHFLNNISLYENLQKLLSNSDYSSFSFEKFLKYLIDYLTQLISEDDQMIIFVQIFELISKIQCLASTTLDQMKKQARLPYEHQHTLDKIKILCQSTEKIMELNKMKILSNSQYSIVKHSFDQFNQYFQRILFDQWKNHGKKSRASLSSSAKDNSIDSVRTTSDKKAQLGSAFDKMYKSFDRLLPELGRRKWTNFYVLNRMNDECTPPKSSLNRKLLNLFDENLDEIEQLLKTLDHYQTQTRQIQSLETSNCSTPASVHDHQQEFIKHKPMVNSKRKVIDVDEDASSEASQSSVDDDTLSKIAKDACKQGLHCFK